MPRMTKPFITTPAAVTSHSESRAGKTARTAEQQITGCRWIDGDVQTPLWRYCQRPRLPGRSYCGEHHLRSINPDGDRQFMAEQAECEHYLHDLPPPDDQLDDEMDEE
jgi:hypothetical protein